MTLSWAWGSVQWTKTAGAMLFLSVIYSKLLLTSEMDVLRHETGSLGLSIATIKVILTSDRCKRLLQLNLMGSFTCFLRLPSTFSMVLKIPWWIIHTNYFPDALLFLQSFTRIAIQFGVCSEQHHGNSRNMSRFLQNFAVKTSIFVSTHATICLSKLHFAQCKSVFWSCVVAK